jgi:hypothetical protein
MSSPGRRGIRQAVVCLLALVQSAVLSCGHRLPPPGGPEDEEGPILVETQPAQSAVGVDPASAIAIVFDEDLDAETAEKAVILSPAHEELEVNASGERLELQPEGGLFPNTTYQVTVKSSLLDERGNSFEAPFTFYFSTGDSLDTGLILGKVTYRGKGAAGAYVKASTLPDSIRYIVQADSAGKYRLAQLPRRNYSLHAFLDQNNDAKYRFAVEPFADARAEVAAEPVQLDFELAVIDTSPPVLEAVEPRDSTAILLVFDDPMKRVEGGIPVTSFHLTPERDSTVVVGIASAANDTLQPEAIVVTTERSLIEGGRYWIAVRDIVNESGLPVRPAEGRQKFAFYLR